MPVWNRNKTFCVVTAHTTLKINDRAKSVDKVPIKFETITIIYQ